jgi:hypothetical protein
MCTYYVYVSEWQFQQKLLNSSTGDVGPERVKNCDLEDLTALTILLLVGGLEHEFYFPYIGNFIIPSDEFIFFRGVGSTTNQ